MTIQHNLFQQPVGFPLPGWTPPPLPPRTPLAGRYCRVEALAADQHASALYTANAADSGRMWTYLPYGPFAGYGDYKEWLDSIETSTDPLFYVITEQATGQAGGIASYLRIDQKNGVIEVGHIAYAPRLRRTPAATEAMFLLMERVFKLGYRRYEWKCDALNAPSRAAAQRLGFSYEGTFRQAVIYKGRNRDTAWYAMTDQDWPAIRDAFVQWLEPGNFDERGEQRVALSALTGPLLVARG
ncbi:MAG TPA: GNAT family protein [Caldilineaceae bacterium]|mgnify:CR=1 FL=1|nr:GNAT family protein [Caldilineaceae bacterium]